MKLLFNLIGMIVLMAAAAGNLQSQNSAALPRRTLDAAAQAMGGWDALRAVRVQRVTSEGSEWDPMQGMRPGENRQLNSFRTTVTADFTAKSLRIEFSGQLLYPSSRPKSYAEVISLDAGMLEEKDARGAVVQTRLHPSRLATRLRDMNRMPVHVLITASEAKDLKELPIRSRDGVSHQVLHYTDGAQGVELMIDARTHIPVSIAYMEDDPIWGDARNEITWSDWKSVGAVKLPHSQEQRLNGRLCKQETIKDVQNNPAAGASVFLIPEEIRQKREEGERIAAQFVLGRIAAGVPYEDFGRPQKATLIEIAPGIFRTGGSGHQSLIVEMKDHLLVVEAPLFEERSLAVISAIKEKFPGKPVRYLVVTHFHGDHIGGLRTYVAEGAAIVAHSSIVPLLEEILSAPRTIHPDSLALRRARDSSQKPFAFERIDGIKDYSDGSRVVQLYPFPNPHSEGALLTFLPKEAITFTADLVFANNRPIDPSNENARVVYDFITKQKLKVDRLFGVHGSDLPFQQFAAAIEGKSGPVDTAPLRPR